MMPIKKKKPSLSVILGMGGPKEDPALKAKDMEGKVEAAREILEAAKKDDPEGFSTALSAFIDLHLSEEDDEDDGEEEDVADEEEEGEL